MDPRVEARLRVIQWHAQHSGRALCQQVVKTLLGEIFEILGEVEL